MVNYHEILKLCTEVQVCYLHIFLQNFENIKPFWQELYFFILLFCEPQVVKEFQTYGVNLKLPLLTLCWRSLGKEALKGLTFLSFLGSLFLPGVTKISFLPGNGTFRTEISFEKGNFLKLLAMNWTTWSMTEFENIWSFVFSVSWISMIFQVLQVPFWKPLWRC